MAPSERLESRVSLRVVAGILSVVLHLGLFLVILYSGAPRYGVAGGDEPVVQLVMLESRRFDHLDGVVLKRWQPTVANLQPRLQLKLQSIQPPSPRFDEPQSPAFESTSLVEVDPTPAALEKNAAPAEVALSPAIDTASAFVMPQAQAARLVQRLERIARKKLALAQHVEAKWQEDGRQYQAELTLERAKDGVELDHVVAEVSANDGDRHLNTRILLRRLSFSQFAQIVDSWDPMVQLHADEIIGRMHVNSRFNLLYDSQAKPTLFGKVSTSAGSFNLRSKSAGSESDVFKEGIETRAERITLAEHMQPLESVSRDASARIHKFVNDTRIRFLADGRYWWRESKSLTSQLQGERSPQSVYFVAAPGVTLYVQGVINGKVLVYSPHRIVVEGSLTYAHDPRREAESGDYLGLVCDKDIDIATPDITGPGDIDIYAALFAKRRFGVSAFDWSRPAALRIYGSLAAGTLTPTEPRYATKIEYDKRFDRYRPPGFPSINRFAAENWDGRWTEAPEQAAAQ